MGVDGNEEGRRGSEELETKKRLETRESDGVSGRRAHSVPLSGRGSRVDTLPPIEFRTEGSEGRGTLLNILEAERD